MIQIEAEIHWEMYYITNPEIFFLALNKILPYGSILYFEAHRDSQRLRTFLSHYPSKRIHNTYGLCPELSEHACFTPNFAQEIISPENFHVLRHFDHLYGYGDDFMIFNFHDAFTGGNLRINRRLPSSTIQDFCVQLTPIYSLKEPIV